MAFPLGVKLAIQLEGKTGRGISRKPLSGLPPVLCISLFYFSAGLYFRISI